MPDDQDRRVRRDDPITVSAGDRCVDVTRIHTPKGVRLEINSRHWNERVRLDALALESICWQDEADFPLDPEALDADPAEVPALPSAAPSDSDSTVQVTNEFAQVYARKLVADGVEGLELESPKLGFSIRLGVPALERIAFEDPEFFSSFLEDPYGPEDEH